jgi:proline iminopeptidase
MKNKLLLMATALLSVIFITGCEKDINEPGNLVPKTVDQDPTLPSILVNGT